MHSSPALTIALAKIAAFGNLDPAGLVAAHACPTLSVRRQDKRDMRQPQIRNELPALPPTRPLM